MHSEALPNDGQPSAPDTHAGPPPTSPTHKIAALVVVAVLVACFWSYANELSVNPVDAGNRLFYRIGVLTGPPLAWLFGHHFRRQR
ncbi:MAG: hypothetical protein H6739_41605 [Alphaproteobacteria bacterium]|nr:hypothetical protein [Alphaproteobacteria bacterium]